MLLKTQTINEKSYMFNTSAFKHTFSYAYIVLHCYCLTLTML